MTSGSDLEPASALAAIDVTPVDRPKSPAEEFALKLLTESWIDETGQHDRRVMARLIQEAEMAIRADEREPLERQMRELTELARKSREQIACGASPDGILSNLLGDIEAMVRLSARKEVSR